MQPGRKIMALLFIVGIAIACESKSGNVSYQNFSPDAEERKMLSFARLSATLPGFYFNNKKEEPEYTSFIKIKKYSNVFSSSPGPYYLVHYFREKDGKNYWGHNLALLTIKNKALKVKDLKIYTEEMVITEFSLVDFDNDGLLDFFFAWAFDVDPPSYYLYKNDGNQFVETNLLAFTDQYANETSVDNEGNPAGSYVKFELKDIDQDKICDLNIITYQYERLFKWQKGRFVLTKETPYKAWKK